MAQTMIASQMTDGQIENVCGKLRDALRKHREEITSDAAQKALGADNIGMRMFAPFREQAEKLSEMIIRRVRVNRTQTRQQAIDATGRVKYVNPEVVAEMPDGEDEEVDVGFFPLHSYTSARDVQKLIAEHGLVSDPRAVAKANEDDPSFGDTRPNATQWVDDKGRHCYLACSQWGDGKRNVSVHRNEGDWDDCWWFGGRLPRK